MIIVTFFILLHFLYLVYPCQYFFYYPWLVRTLDVGKLCIGNKRHNEDNMYTISEPNSFGQKLIKSWVIYGVVHLFG
jgi:hypothetical protein